MSVLAVFTEGSQARALADLGLRVARAYGEGLTLLCLWPGDDGEVRAHQAGQEPAGIEQAGLRRLVAALAELVAADRAHEEEGDPAAAARAAPEVEILSQVCRRPARQVLRHLDRSPAHYLLLARGRSPARGPFGEMGRNLFATAPCHTLLARFREGQPGAVRRVLVPTAGGPHASIALRLGEKIARREGGVLTPLLVEPDVSELSQAVGERLLGRALKRARVGSGPHVQPRVVLARRREAGIAGVADEGCDLLLLGASNRGNVRSLLFGTLPERLLAGPEAVSVAVVRARRKLADRLRARIGRWLDLTIPQLEREERVALYTRLESGSVWNFDFMTLIGASTAIATFGLLQDSAAVVIGAMLVAPLMTPILGAGLALVQGNWPLARRSLDSIARGYLMALAIGALLGWLVPGAELTGQLVARGGPSPLDMGVALLSGLAAAHCMGRAGLLSALPGVAIAAALVPPIATTGVCLALGDLATARGAALLFGTNVISIVLGAAFSFYAGGVRGRAGRGWRRRWVRLAVTGLLLAAALLVVPLSRPWREHWRSRSERPPPAAVAELRRGLERHGAELASLRRSTRAGVRLCEIDLRSATPPGDALLEEIRAVTADFCAGDQIRVHTQLVSTVDWQEDFPSPSKSNR